MRFNKEDKLKLEQFFILKEKEQFKDCLSILLPLKLKYKANRVINALLGMVYFELEQYQKSLDCFRKVIISKPKSELASLCIFQCLRSLGKDRLALKEVERYLKIAKPRLYKVTIKELYLNIDEFDSSYDRKVINRLYDMLKGRRHIKSPVVRYTLAK